MKSYTDLEQSKKLAEILPIESADYTRLVGKNEDNVLTRPYLESFSSELAEWIGENNIFPCWSLAALLDYLRKIELFPSMETDEDGVVMYISCFNADGIYTIDTTAKDFIDAYCSMIIKLHEQNLL